MNMKVKVLQLAGAMLMALSNASYAQVVGQISLTQIAEQNAENYNNILTQLIDLGEDGFKELIEIVKNNEEGKVSAEYAITAYVAEISNNDFDKDKRDAIIEILLSEAKNAVDGNYKEFMIRELMVLGINFDNKNASIIGSSEFDVPAVPTNKKDLEAILKDKTATRQGRFYVLNYAQKNEENSKVVIKCLNRSKDDEAIIDMLYWLGESKIISNADAIAKFVSGKKSPNVCKEAVSALAKLGRESDIKVIADLYALRQQEYSDIATLYLKTFSGKVTDVAVSQFNNADDLGKAGIIELIAQRNDSNYKDLIKQSLESSESIVKDAAYSALSTVVDKGDTQYLYSLLENCASDKVTAVQKAIIASFGSQSKENINNALILRKDFVGGSLEDLYWPMIISTSSIDDLFDICNSAKDDDLFDKAFTAYVNEVRSLKEPGAKQLLRFREIMPLTRTARQKSVVLDNIARTDCFLAIIYAGQFLDNKEIQQRAAQVIRRIGTAHVEYNSPDVIDLLKKAAIVITGTDPGYEVTSINKHLEDLPKDTIGYVTLDRYLNDKQLNSDADFDIYVDLKQGNVGANWNSFHVIKSGNKSLLLLNGKEVDSEEEVKRYIQLIFDVLKENRPDILARDIYIKYE